MCVPRAGTGWLWQKGAGMFGNTKDRDWGPHKQLGLLTSWEVGHSRGGGKGLCLQGMFLHYKNHFSWIQSQGEKAASTSATDSNSLVQAGGP